MKPEPTTAEVGKRLVELTDQRRGVTLTSLSRMIGRRDSYLGRFVKRGVPVRLEPAEIKHLATFFGVEEWELGGFISPTRAP